MKNLAPTITKNKPYREYDFADANGKTLSGFKKGKLVYAVLVPYKGKGTPKVILHEALLMGEEASFGYGGGKAWVLKPKSKR
jgi:hypothetical protein